MQTDVRAQRRDLGRRVARRHSAAALIAAAATAGTACHDAVNVTAPTPPALNVSSNGTWLVNSLADPGDGMCTNSECTLREAIAGAQDGDRIGFKGNLSGTIPLTAGTLIIDKNLTIEGPGPNVLTVNGQGASTVFQIGADAPVGLAILSGLTITGGQGTQGGGIKVLPAARLTLIGSMVVSNSAQQGGGIYGTGNMTLVGSTIATNVATNEGGGIWSGGVLTISGSTISGNRVLQSQGGGIKVVCFTFCGLGASIRSSTITRNEAPGGGGGVIILTPTTVMNTIIAGNTENGDPAAQTADCWITSFMTSLGYNLSTSNTGCSLPSPIASAVWPCFFRLFWTNRAKRGRCPS